MYTSSRLTVVSKKDGIHYVAICLPPTSFSWSLGNFYSQDEADAQEDLSAAIADLALEFGIRKIFAPSVAAHSAMIVDPRSLNIRIRLHRKHDISLYRNSLIRADGIPLKPGQGFVMSGGGCPVCVVSGHGLCIPVHASRESLIDRKRVEYRASSRPFESVLDAAVAEFSARGIPNTEIRVRSCFHIKPEEFLHDFSDPAHGEFNMKLCSDIFDRYGTGIMSEPEGKLDLPALIARRATQLGLLETVRGAPLPPGYAHTRRPGELAKQRNLVFVARLT